MAVIRLDTQDPNVILAVAQLAAKENQSLDVDYFIPTAERWLDYLAGVSLATMAWDVEDTRRPGE